MLFVRKHAAIHHASQAKRLPESLQAPARLSRQKIFVHLVKAGAVVKAPVTTATRAKTASKSEVRAMVVEVAWHVLAAMEAAHNQQAQRVDVRTVLSLEWYVLPDDGKTKTKTL